MALSKREFLTAVTGEPQPFDAPGVGLVVVRPLGTLEVEQLAEYAGSDVETMFRLVARGLVEPALAEEDFPAFRNGLMGKIAPIAQRIMELSGMDEKALEGEAGGGS